MARKPRVEYDGAFYHVIVRGNQQQRTFRDDQDRITTWNAWSIIASVMDFACSPSA